MNDKCNMTPAQRGAILELAELVREVAKEHDLFMVLSATDNAKFECVTYAYGDLRDPRVISAWIVGMYNVINKVGAMNPANAAMIGAIEGKRYAGGHGPCMAQYSKDVMRDIMDQRLQCAKEDN